MKASFRISLTKNDIDKIVCSYFEEDKCIPESHVKKEYILFRTEEEGLWVFQGSYTPGEIY